jgi:hypothetical protein
MTMDASPEEKRNCQQSSTQCDWLARCCESLDIIGRRIYDLRDARDMYETYTGIVRSNPQVHGNVFLELLDEMYVTYMLIGIRSVRDTDRRSHSLYNVIKEVCDRRECLSKKWFVDRHRPECADDAERRFEENWGNGGFPAEHVLTNDLSLLDAACKKARQICNEYLAHNDRRRQNITLDLEKMRPDVDTILHLWRKYCDLVRGTAWSRDPPYAWEQVFDKPWR